MRTREHVEAIRAAKRENARFDLYVATRRRMEELWALVSKPLKFPAPARRRRSDREIPKAA